MTFDQAEKFLRDISKSLPRNVPLQRHLIPKWQSHRYDLALRIILAERGRLPHRGKAAPSELETNS